MLKGIRLDTFKKDLKYHICFLLLTIYNNFLCLVTAYCSLFHALRRLTSRFANDWRDSSAYMGDRCNCSFDSVLL